MIDQFDNQYTGAGFQSTYRFRSTQARGCIAIAQESPRPHIEPCQARRRIYDLDRDPSGKIVY